MTECDVCEKMKELCVKCAGIKVCRQCLLDGVALLDAKVKPPTIVETTAEEGAWETPSWDDVS